MNRTLPAASPVAHLSWPRRIARPIGELLRQGITPRDLALSLAVGWVTGTFPIIGVTLIMCVGLVAIFRLNQIAAQITNWLAYPALFLLFIPHMRLGEFICRAERIPISVTHIRAVTAQGAGVFIKTFGMGIFHAAVGWLALAPFVFLVVYAASLPITRLVSARLQKEAEPLGR